MGKLSSPNIRVSTVASAAVWGLATTGGMRRSMADLDVVPVLVSGLKRTFKMPTHPDGEAVTDGPDGMVSEKERALLQRNMLGALAVLLIDRWVGWHAHDVLAHVWVWMRVQGAALAMPACMQWSPATAQPLTCTL